MARSNTICPDRGSDIFLCSSRRRRRLLRSAFLRPFTIRMLMDAAVFSLDDDGFELRFMVIPLPTPHKKRDPDR